MRALGISRACAAYGLFSKIWKRKRHLLLFCEASFPSFFKLNINAVILQSLAQKSANQYSHIHACKNKERKVFKFILTFIRIIKVRGKVMETESELYYQSQEFITPIVDYIPVESDCFPESARWRLKERLDQSRQKVTEPSFEQQQVSSARIYSRNERLQTESATNEIDKKTTSIMQGYSANTIPSNELSIHTIKDNLRSYLTYHPPKKVENMQSNMVFFSNQNSSQGVKGMLQHQRKRSRSINDGSGVHFMKERGKLLRSIDKSFESHHRSVEKERYQLKELGKERKQILSEILQKLESNVKQKKEVQLVKSNCKDTEASLATKPKEGTKPKEKQSVFSKKTKKWVQVKNNLKEAASQSNELCISHSKVLQQHKIVQSAISEWHQQSQQDQFSSPTLITSITNTRPNYEQPHQSTSFNNYTSHKNFPSPNKKHEDIYTFSNIYNPNLEKHIKNVSITISESSSKEESSTIKPQAMIQNCVLCKIIGKRCSFH